MRKDNISWYTFCLGIVSQDFITVYNFSVDHGSIKKEHNFNIHQYLMIKNNIKWSLSTLSRVADLTKYLFLND